MHPWSMRAEGEVVGFPSERVEAWARFDTFFEDEHDRLYKALYFVTGNRQDAEELMQDAFLKLWERWDSIHEIEDPTGYLFRIGLNGFRMRRRRTAMSVRKVIPVPEARDLFSDAEMRADVRALLLAADVASEGCPPARGPARVPIRAGGTHPACPSVHREGPGHQGSSSPPSDGRSAGCLICRRCSAWRRRRWAPTRAPWSDSIGSNAGRRPGASWARSPWRRRSASRRSR